MTKYRIGIQAQIHEPQELENHHHTFFQNTQIWVSSQRTACKLLPCWLWVTRNRDVPSRKFTFHASAWNRVNTKQKNAMLVSWLQSTPATQTRPVVAMFLCIALLPWPSPYTGLSFLFKMNSGRTSSESAVRQIKLAFDVPVPHLPVPYLTFLLGPSMLPCFPDSSILLKAMCSQGTIFNHF